MHTTYCLGLIWHLNEPPKGRCGMKTKYRVWNVDKTGLSVVQTKIPQVIASRGKRQICSLTAAECGSLVMVICLLSAGAGVLSEGNSNRSAPDIINLFHNSCDDKIYYRLVTDPFHIDVDVLPDRLQEEVLEIKNDSAAKYDFNKMDKPLFWVKYLTVYPSTAEQALKLYLPFSSTYLCERAFSEIVAIKNKLRSKLSIANDLRCAVSAIQPRIQNLVKNLQAHPSH
ncbi:SCAN domain-containing protein 3-like [Schistocerca americana]|uniref:SCAN domain-containing protein 3-like n=1 Tax=Schistocerca americana TaxID=7009 RepID=UPI001F4F367C|nr:SCAN domain-containing protein 3-like [Schistocerca americana]